MSNKAEILNVLENWKSHPVNKNVTVRLPREQPERRSGYSEHGCNIEYALASERRWLQFRRRDERSRQ